MKKIIASLLSVVLTVCTVPLTATAQEETLIDSGIDYNETVSTINNIGAGYTSTIWYVCKPGDTPVKNPQGNLTVLFVDIGAFSSGINGTTDSDGNYTEGVDYDLDESFFNGLRGTLENCRKNGCTVGLRFRYDANGKTNPEPSTFEKVLEHIQQIGDSGILSEYEDILMYVESGFVGAWGEQHSGKYTSTEYKAKVLDALLKIVPESVSVTVRTPNTFCMWAGIGTDELTDYISEGDAKRVGLYNDGYMGSDTDLGTFINPNRENSVKWMKNQMKYTYYGGEFSGNIGYAQKYTTYLPENAIAEMYDTHLSYINSNIWSLYKDYTFSEDYSSVKCDNSAYYGQTVYQFIRDHIGYRFVLRDSDLTSQTVQGGNIKVKFSVENTGFANPIKKQNSQVILEKDGIYIVCESDIDDRIWYSTETTDETLNIKLPGNIQTGNWNVYLRLSAGNADENNVQRTVKFANADIYNNSLGANFLGTVTVNKTDNSDLLSDNTFYEEGAETVSDGTLYDYNGKIKIDGIISEREWNDDKLVLETEKSKLYVTSDKENLYICAVVPDTAKSPVYNLQWKGTDDANRYWTYYQSNGFIYFSGEDSSGIVCKYNGGVSEWKIPLTDNLNMYPGKNLEYLRFFVQDSSDNWSVVDDLKISNYTLYSSVYGDINSDGVFNIADAVTLQKWIMNDTDSVSDWLAGDLYEDGILNIFDLCVMKQKLTELL